MRSQRAKLRGIPKQVDHRERRELIAAALMRVAADEGLEAVSLRHVAAAAGVTSGMVQHYFPSKAAILDYAMQTASDRYAARMTEAVGNLGDDPPPSALIRAVLTTLLPLDGHQRADARVALAFQSYAATNPQAADRLRRGNAELRAFLADQIRAAAGDTPVAVHAERTATALFALAEGLAVHMLSGALAVSDAEAALEAQIELWFRRS